MVEIQTPIHVLGQIIRITEMYLGFWWQLFQHFVCDNIQETLQNCKWMLWFCIKNPHVGIITHVVQYIFCTIYIWDHHNKLFYFHEA